MIRLRCTDGLLEVTEESAKRPKLLTDVGEAGVAGLTELAVPFSLALTAQALDPADCVYERMKAKAYFGSSLSSIIPHVVRQLDAETTPPPAAVGPDEYVGSCEPDVIVYADRPPQIVRWCKDPQDFVQHKDSDTTVQALLRNEHYDNISVKEMVGSVVSLLIRPVALSERQLKTVNRWIVESKHKFRYVGPVSALVMQLAASHPFVVMHRMGDTLERLRYLSANGFDFTTTALCVFMKSHDLPNENISKEIRRFVVESCPPFASGDPDSAWHDELHRRCRLWHAKRVLTPDLVVVVERWLDEQEIT